jgi:hypothetical protein
MRKKFLNATKNDPYSPDGAFNLIYVLDKCISNSNKSALRSRPHSGGFAEENLKTFSHIRPST